jgi:hypothetical protein
VDFVLMLVALLPYPPRVTGRFDRQESHVKEEVTL